jgi:catalase
MKLELNTEYPQPNEEEVTKKIVDLLREIVEGRFLQGLTYRGVNTKSHAGVRAEFIVDPNLPEEFRVGVFREPRRYPAWIRYSSTLPDPLPDKVPDLRGMAVKLMDVDGPKLLPADRDGKTHDFIFITPQTFFTSTPEDFYKFALTGAMNSKKTLADYWNILTFMLSHPAVAACIFNAQTKIPSLLEANWYSATPYLFGSRAVKYSLRPWLAPRTAMPAKSRNNYLREDLVHKLRDAEAGFDFRIQFQLDPYKQPIEDALVVWKKQDSPWHKIGTILLPKQEIDSPEQMLFCEHLSMNPWRCIAEHRPLGGVNRSRQRIYYDGSAYRHGRNAVPVTEPHP